MREARLRPEYADLYPTLTPGQWEPAARVAEVVLARLLLLEISDAPLQDRVLPEEHFEFRGETPMERHARQAGPHRRQGRRVRDRQPRRTTCATLSGRFASTATGAPPGASSGSTKLPPPPASSEPPWPALTRLQLDTPYRDNGWTVRQVVHHIPDSHLNAYTRIKLALTEEEPTIKPYEEARWAELPDARGGPIEPSLACWNPCTSAGCCCCGN